MSQLYIPPNTGFRAKIKYSLGTNINTNRGRLTYGITHTYISPIFDSYPGTVYFIEQLNRLVYENSTERVRILNSEILMIAPHNIIETMTAEYVYGTQEVRDRIDSQRPQRLSYRDRNTNRDNSRSRSRSRNRSVNNNTPNS